MPHLRLVECIGLALIASLIAFACGSDEDGTQGAGSAAAAGTSRGGTAGSAAGGKSGGGSSSDQGGGAGAEDGPGGVAGSSSEGGIGGDQGIAGESGAGGVNGAGGSGTSGACDERSGGALIDFEIAGETLRVWIENDAFIDEALMLLDSGESRIPVFNTLLNGQDCDAQWTWHPDPQNVEFADFTIELCDGLPSHIEADKSYWFDTVTTYCPWSAMVTAVDDRR